MAARVGTLGLLIGLLSLAGCVLSLSPPPAPIAARLPARIATPSALTALNSGRRPARVAMADEPEEWSPPGVFSKENAGPWAILVIITAFQYIATLPRDSLPLWLQTLIPVILGRQYEVPM